MKRGFGAWLGLVALTMGFSGPVLADDTLDRGIRSEWSSLDPQVNIDGAAGWIQMDVYEGLVSFDEDGHIVPGRKAGRPRPMGGFIRSICATG